MREIAWFQTGGVTHYYTVCHSLDDIVTAVRQAGALQVPYRVIGDGSNVLMSDSGYPGLIIQNRATSMLFVHDRSQVIVDAGTPLSHVVSRAISLGYSGLEFLSGIPGTVGGAVYGNATVGDSHIGNYVKSATLLFPREKAPSSGIIRRIDREWFEFSPYTSRLKQMQSIDPEMCLPIILSVTIQLSKMSHETCLQKVKAITPQRLPKFPVLRPFSTVRLKQNGEQTIINHPALTQAMHYVDRAQVKQWHIGAVSVFQDDPNFIINSGYGASKQAWELIHLMQHAEASDLHPLQTHIERVGLWDDESDDISAMV